MIKRGVRTKTNHAPRRAAGLGRGLLAAIAIALLAAPVSAAPHSPKWRGVVEGFNDVPWTHAARLAQIRWMGAHGMNLYIYAPKRDPYHRARWREPYPPSEMAHFREMARVGKQNGVLVMVAVSPGLSIHYSRESDVRALLAKFDALAAAGIPRFALFLDDIPWQLQYDDDRAAFANLGEAHAALWNRVLTHLRQTGRAVPFVGVGTEYYTLDETPYKRALREHLDQGVLFMWTGDGGPKRATITPESVGTFTRLYGRPPFLWDNYPVNDYNKTRLFFAPLVQRGDIGALVSGYTLNPLTQPAAARLTLYTAADYLANTAHPHPWASWQRAKDELFGHDPAARPLMDAIVELNVQRPFGPRGGPLLTGLVNTYLHSPTTAARDRAEHRLRALFTLCANARARLVRARPLLPLPAFADDIRPWLPAIEAAGRAGLLALQQRAHPAYVTATALQVAWTKSQGNKRVAEQPLEALVSAALTPTESSKNFGTGGSRPFQQSGPQAGAYPR